MNDQKKKENKKRIIDENAENMYSWWKKSFVVIRKTKVRTWQGVFVLAFVAGSVVALVTSVSMDIQSTTKADGETASLMLDAATVNVTQGESFTLDVVLNTNDNDVVVTRAIVNYDTDNFTLTDWNTDNSAFVAGNTCVYNNKPCEIVDNNTTNGIIDITLMKPSPGVNTSSGIIATLTFQASANSQTDDINLTFDSRGTYTTDSAVIFDGSSDDGAGTDILAGVTNSHIVVSAPTCTSFVYTDWTECQPDGTQSRTVTSSLPDGCSDGDPVLEQTCTYNGGSETCTSFVYTDWTECQPDGTQSRTVTSSLPDGCSDGDPVLSQTCSYTQPNCISFVYSNWGECRSDGTQLRTIFSRNPSNCIGGNASLTANCEYVDDTSDDDDDVVVVDSKDKSINVDKPKAKITSGKKAVSLSKSKKVYSKESKVSLRGDTDGLTGGKVQIYIDKKLKYETSIKDNGKWSKKVKIKKNGTYDIKFKYLDKNDTVVSESSKYQIKVDTKKPKFEDIPAFLTKKLGDKVWWKATDNNKVKYYKYYFNGKKKETKKDSFIIPVDTPRGVHLLKIRAYDKAGNKKTQWTTINVR